MMIFSSFLATLSCESSLRRAKYSATLGSTMGSSIREGIKLTLFLEKEMTEKLHWRAMRYTSWTSRKAIDVQVYLHEIFLFRQMNVKTKY